MRTYKCNHCGQKFHSESEAIRHFINRHADNRTESNPSWTDVSISFNDSSYSSGGGDFGGGGASGGFD